MDEDDEDDPFAARDQRTPDAEGDSEEEREQALSQDADEDDGIDSDEALANGDVEGFKHLEFGGSKKNQTNAGHSDDEELSEADHGDEAIEDSRTRSTGTSDIDMDEEEGSQHDLSSISSADSSPHETLKSARATDRHQLRQAARSASSSGIENPLLGNAKNADRAELRRAAESASTAGLASALSAGANAEVKKGQAVKQQRQTFDRLLDVRIKVQKGITAINELDAEAISDEEVKNAAKSAEDAALALWSTIDSIRCHVISNGKSTSDSNLKRKRALKPTRSTPLAQIWEHTTSLESQVHPYRRSVLDKWHSKTQPIIDASQPRSKVLKPSQASNSRLTDVLDTYLLSESAALTSQSYSSSAQAFDDATFYQSLLRDLISSRSAADSSGALVAQSAIPQKLHLSGSKHKKVDTKASKGRKIRYTVHEKLENFIAAEDRNTWTEAARTEFFGSLLGNVNALVERDVDGLDDIDEDIAEGEALRLFRS